MTAGVERVALRTAGRDRGARRGRAACGMTGVSHGLCGGAGSRAGR